ncbi:hypothetical protein FTO68_07210 [Methanocalculus taiwanensis]|uniref:Uncharacterized protein n=1 Tax=Methanocalculus taiwanensis TaxID=106207 RepID=A0ABD4TJA4_9EURY|nr:hypothetical protein [Methanocalculus taiwanensis]MCQ1538771.1 hypothetical protein [Methanocalculus taiwanensis]
MHPHTLSHRSTLRLIATLLFILISTIGITSADLVINWEITSGEYDETRAFDIQQTDDGGYIIVGATIHPGEEGYTVPSPFYQAYIIRVTSSGEKLFEKTIDDERTRAISRIIRTQDSTYAMAGSISDPPNHDSDAYLAQMDKDGTILWERAYGGEHYDSAFDLVEVESGGFAIIGVTTRTETHPDQDIYLIRTDDAGDILFEKSYGDKYTDSGHSISKTRDGGFIIAGDGAFSLIRTDESGSILWTKSLRESSDVGSGVLTTPNAIMETSDGAFIAAGTTLSNDGDGFTLHASLMKIDQNGEIIWQKDYPGDGVSSFSSVVQLESGDICAVGGTGKPDPLGNPLFTEESSIFLVRIDGSKDPIMQTSIRRGGYSTGNALLISDDAFIIAGSVSTEKGGDEGDDKRGERTRAFAISLSNDGDEMPVKEQSASLFYAPILAVPLFIFSRWRRIMRRDS